MTIEGVREYKFDPKKVIEGLNGYYAKGISNSFIRVYRDIVRGPVYLGPDVWLSALIEWLRVDHDIFYYPGMDVCDSREAGMEATKEDVWKNIMNCIRQEPSPCGFGLPRACRDLIEDLKKRDAEIVKMKEEIRNLNAELEDLLHKSVDSVNKECKAVGKQMVDDYEKDLLQFICKEYKNRIRLNDSFISYDPPSVRNTVLKIISDYARCRIRVDILETRIKSIFDKGKTKFTVDDYVLDGDPTTMFMLDYISSWIGSPAESRGKTRAEIENYKLKLKDYILHGIKKRGYRYDGLEKKSIEDIVDWIITMATCANKEVEDAKKETKQECYDYLWNALKELSPECDALKIDRYEDLVDRIFYEMSLINDNCKRCQRKHSTEKFDYIRNIQRANKAEEEVKKLNDVIKKQKELLNEINKEEENEWFKP